jgi:ATP-dependent exoDNAse (exonuclease V) beta subunit
MTDSVARATALDPSRSFVVQAPAGSGKTSLLTQRFLRLLATVDAPEQIVAITFTRKAAAQMRHQIIQTLAHARDEPAAEEPYSRLSRELARVALERARALEWDLEANPGRLRIQTIDAFCHSLAAQLPMLSRAGAELEVADDPWRLYAEAARRTLQLLDEDHSIAVAAAVLLLHRDNELLQTERLLLDLLAKRDQWLPLIVGGAGKGLRARLEADIATEVTRCLSDLQARWPRDHLQVAAGLAKFAASNLAEEAGELAAWRDYGQPPQAALEHVALWRGLAQLLLTQDSGTWRRSIDRRQGFPPSARNEKSRLQALIAELARVPDLAELLGAVRYLPPIRLDEAQWQVAEAIIGLLKVAAAELELVFRASGEVDHVAVAQAAMTALGNAEEPGELALALDHRLRHILVDEFQDSSYTQIRLLEALTAGWSDGDGRTLFCVGDPMQSIYRFRQAEVGLFLRTRDRGLGELRPVPLTLERNFRSSPELVCWFNEVFARALPPQDDLGRGAVRHAASTAARTSSEMPAVHVHSSFSSDPAQEAKEIAAVIASHRQRDPRQTIGVLVRQRQHAVHLSRVLRESGSGFQAVELEPLIDQPVVRDLVALSRAMLHFGDRIAWLAVLRSPLCGLTLRDLVALTRGPRELTCWELLHDAARIATLSADGQARVQAMLKVLDPALDRNGRVPLRPWVEGTWLGLGGPAATPETRALEDAAAYFERLESLADGSVLPSGAAFDAQFADLYAQPDPNAPPELQIMTIHKAKGLEFDVVILPGLGRGRGRNIPPLLRWLEVPRAEGDSGLLLAPIERRGSDGDPLFDYLGFRERQRDEFERGRLLYVATTRARESLHLFGHVKPSPRAEQLSLGQPESQSLLALLWPSVRDEFERALARRDPAMESQAAVRESVPTRIARHAAGWRLPTPPPCVARRQVAAVVVERQVARPEFDWAGEVSRHIGVVVHEELERWSRLPALPSAREIEARRGVCQRHLEARAVPAELIVPAVDRIMRSLMNTLADARGRWIFDPVHRDRRSEYALTGVVDGQIISVVIDRTFVDSTGLRWIVDFKTSSHEGGAVDEFLDHEVERYRPQLQRYARLIDRVATGPIRVGLYFPLLGGWREWSP